MNSSDKINLIGIILVFIVGIGGIVVTLYTTRRTNKVSKEINKKSIRATTVAVERNAWKNELRKSISEFCSFTRHWALGSVAFDKHTEQELLLRIDYMRSYIKLSLNPNGEIERVILALLEEIPTLTDASKHDTLMAKINEMEALAQNILKQSWEDIKNETNFKD